MFLIKSLIFDVISYFVGTISGAYLVGNKYLGTDIRNYGSGNAGSTNAIRVLGKKWGVITFVIDFLKGSLVAFIAKKVLQMNDFSIAIAILFCVLGHDFPFYMNFKGGKGVATTMGAFTVFNIKLTFIAWATWMIVVLITKMASLGSILFFIVLAIMFTVSGLYSFNTLVVVYIIMLLGIIKHRSNIIRIINGNENRIGQVKK